MKRRILAALLAISMMALGMSGTPESERIVQAAEKTLNIETAKLLALDQSSAYKAIANKLTLKQAQYTQSVKKLRLKEEKQRTFSWSPFLNFKLPEKPDLVDEMEYTYTPLELQSEIDQLKHEQSDSVYSIYEKVELNFVEAYRLQEQISYNENLLNAAQKTLAKNRARLLIGEANETDVTSMETKVSSLEKSIASASRSLESTREKLGTQIGLDLTVGYQFNSPFVDADLNRETLDTLVEYTLDQSDTFYKIQTTSANALLELNTNYKLMAAQYGSGNMSMIDSFINQAKKGEKLDTAAFKLKYNELLKQVDEPWTGSFHILFIKIPKLWIKGAIDGVRYVEDEPLALYESAIEYQNALAEENASRDEITQTVKENYENYVSARNACTTLEESIAKKETELKKDAILNSNGQMTYEEYAAVQEEYESLQADYLQAQADYSSILYSFDRLTCGKIMEYMTGSGVNLSTAEGGSSYVVEDSGDGVYYYIHSLASGTAFELGLTVPPDYEEVNITDYELWIDGIQVGERTNLEGTIQHLTLDTQSTKNVFIRIYEGEEFIDDCEIDPTQYTARLNITTYSIEKENALQVGTYAMETTSTGLVKITITPKAGEEVASYNIKDANGEYLSSDTKVSIHKSFQYLAVIADQMDELTICFYNENEELLYEASFRSSDSTIQKKE